MSSTAEEATAIEEWYGDALRTLDALAVGLTKARGYNAPRSYPVAMVESYEYIADIARRVGRDQIAEQVEAGRLSWTVIGKSLGISRQAASKRYGR